MLWKFRHAASEFQATDDLGALLIVAVCRRSAGCVEERGDEVSREATLGSGKIALRAKSPDRIATMYSRRRFIQTSAAVGAGMALPFEVVSAVETGLNFEPESPLIPAPRDPAAWPEFRKRLAAWREEKRRNLNYSDALYQRPEFAWVKRCCACCFLMLGDEMFFDPVRGGFRVKAFLESGRREFGGFDAVVLWHAYPRIGFDERNQFDFYRDLPGGLAGLRRAVRALHARGVKVFIDYNPWDTGTRREGVSDLEALVEIVRGLEADGIFLDTMDQGAAGFRAQLDAARPGVVLESEGALPLERVGDHHLSWAQWFADSEAPGVLRNKWFSAAICNIRSNAGIAITPASCRPPG